MAQAAVFRAHSDYTASNALLLIERLEAAGNLPAGVAADCAAGRRAFGIVNTWRGLNATVQVFHSHDGVRWSLRSNVSRIYWANLFGHGGDVYLLGTHGDDRPVVSAPHTDERKGGPVTISKSTDQVSRTATHGQDFVATPSLVDSCDSHSPARLC